MALIICEHIRARNGKSGGGEGGNRIIIYFSGFYVAIVKNDEMCFRAVVSATLSLHLGAQQNNLRGLIEAHKKLQALKE